MMKLEQLEIENFKCFKSKKTFNFGRITVLTGANSSGKSTVMQAVWAVLQSENFPLRLSLNGHTITLGDFKQVVNQHDTTKEIRLAFSFDAKYNGQERKAEYKTSWKIDSVNSQAELTYLYIKSTFKEADGFTQNFIITQNDVKPENFDLQVNGDFTQFVSRWINKLEYDRQELEESLPFTFGKNAYDNLEIKDIDLNQLKKLVIKIRKEYLYQSSGRIGEGVLAVDGLIQDSFDLIKVVSKNSNYITPNRTELKDSYFDKNQLEYKITPNGDGFLDVIAEWQKSSKSKINDLIKVLKNLDLITDVKVNRIDGGKFEVLVKANNNSNYNNLTSVGLGVSQFMPIIVADLQLDNGLDNASTLCIAEPEANLHPSIQSKFGDYLINQIKNTDKNYVIGTHSEYLLNRLRLAIVKGELTKEDLKVYFLENNGEDTEVFDIDFTKTGAIKNAPDNFFETYAIDVMDIAMSAFAE